MGYFIVEMLAPITHNGPGDGHFWFRSRTPLPFETAAWPDDTLFIEAVREPYARTKRIEPLALGVSNISISSGWIDFSHIYLDGSATPVTINGLPSGFKVMKLSVAGIVQPITRNEIWFMHDGIVLGNALGADFEEVELINPDDPIVTVSGVPHTLRNFYFEREVVPTPSLYGSFIGTDIGIKSDLTDGQTPGNVKISGYTHGYKGCYRLFLLGDYGIQFIQWTTILIIFINPDGITPDVILYESPPFTMETPEEITPVLSITMGLEYLAFIEEFPEPPVVPPGIRETTPTPPPDVVPPAAIAGNYPGIYTITKDKTNDTVYVTLGIETTLVIKIPIPFARTALFGN